MKAVGMNPVRTQKTSQGYMDVEAIARFKSLTSTRKHRGF